MIAHQVFAQTAVNCFPETSWPKLLGYGKAETEIRSIDRSKVDGSLAMTIVTGEADLIGRAGTSSDTIGITVFDPIQDSYLWFKTHSPSILLLMLSA